MAAGDNINAGLSATALLPFVGEVAGGGKIGARVVSKAVSKSVKYSDKMVEAAELAVKSEDKIADIGKIADDVGKESSKATRDIYRAVSPEEFEDIMTTNSFRGVEGKTLGAKEFGNDFDETLNFANKSINKDKAAIVKVTIPENIYNRLNHMNLDTHIFKSGTPVVEPNMLDNFNKSIINIEHVY